LGRRDYITLAHEIDNELKIQADAATSNRGVA
jgi:hypothetical protein